MDRRATKDFEVWKQQLWSTYVRLESSSAEASFYGEVKRASPYSNLLSFVHSTTQLTERNWEHIKTDPQEVVLVALQVSGHGCIEQHGRQARLASGDFAVYETNRPYKLSFDGPFDQLLVRLPRQILDKRIGQLSSLTASRFDGRMPAVQVASVFLLELAKHAERLEKEALDLFAANGADLLANAVNLSISTHDHSESRRLERLQVRLKQNLRDEGLDIDRVALDEGVSPRTCNRLFQFAGTTPRRWILDQRLEAVALDLQTSALSHKQVSEIAFSWGFNDLSHFNRAFKLKFGLSPKAMRAARAR